MKPSSRSLFRSAALIATLALAPLSALAASAISGTITNKTTNKPAAGDAVVLLNLQQGMAEENRTTTDAHGKFTLQVGSDGAHLIRVDHQKSAYFHSAPPGTTTADIDVFDIAEKVDGVTAEADVMRIEADASGLHVMENFFVKNESAPPRTQLNSHNFEIYLPTDAQIESSAAMAPAGMPVSNSPVPQGDKGHYAFIFPIRPGETRFQVTYRLPYSGSIKLTPRVGMRTENVAVMLPKSIKFDQGDGTAFQSINDDPNAQTFLAKAVEPGHPLAFTLSGTGSMPRENQGAPADQAAQAASGMPNAAASDTRPGGGLGTPIDTPDPLSKYRWWIISGLVVMLAVAAAFLLRSRPATSTNTAARATAAAPAVPLSSPVHAPAYAAPLAAPPVHHAPLAASGAGLLAALKDELFTLETERLEGKITDVEYAHLKSAFETVLRRALARKSV
jgi:hypothetical protein